MLDLERPPLGARVSEERVARCRIGVHELSPRVKAIVSEYTTKEENANGYEAHRRFIDIQYLLKGVTNVSEAFDVYIDDNTTSMFKSIGVLSKAEMDARYEVVNESFVKKLQIESRTIGEICIPSAVLFLNTLSTSLIALDQLSKFVNSSCGTTRKLYEQTIQLIDSISGNVREMTDERATANEIADFSNRAKVYSKTVLETMHQIRSDVDLLESIMDDGLWPLPKYRELFVI